MNRSDVYETITTGDRNHRRRSRAVADALAPERRQPASQRSHEKAIPRSQRSGPQAMRTVIAPASGRLISNGGRSTLRSGRGSARASSSFGKELEREAEDEETGGAQEDLLPAPHGSSTPTRSTAGRRRPPGAEPRRGDRPGREPSRPHPVRRAMVATARTTGAG